MRSRPSTGEARREETDAPWYRRRGSLPDTGSGMDFPQRSVMDAVSVVDFKRRVRRGVPVTGSTLRALALRTLLPAFPGTLPPDWALGLTREGLAGFALFGYNIVDADQIAALTAQLRSARPDVIVATDEEGGDVTRLCYAQGSPSHDNAALGVVDVVNLTHGIYRAIGEE